MKKVFKVPDYPCVALVLQGGGALGSYQAGVLEGLSEIKLKPTWLTGISIGALNCAIIAGNPPGQRIKKLREFWETICQPPSPAAQSLSTLYQLFGLASQTVKDLTLAQTERMFGSYAAAQSILEGQKGFFMPRPMAPGGGSPATTSYYDTTPLIETLEKYADFDRINNGDMRVSVGATNVKSGNFVYFDNTEMKLGPKHFIASSSLPPGFPATEIDGQFYWDGGCVSNTPLEYILNTKPHMDTLIFQVDLWSAQGDLPTDIFEVLERQKDIQYSSRTREVTNKIFELQTLRQLLAETLQHVPAAARKKDPWFALMQEKLFGARYKCIHMIYRNKPTAGHYKDFEFSHETMTYHWQTGLDDMRRTLENPHCLDLPPLGESFVTYDVHRHQ